MSVGLPWGVMGNSEVGHQTMGVGQIIFEDLPIIDMAIQTGSFYKNEVLREAMATAKQNNANLHIWGLVSDGAVHSKLKHLYALLQMAKLMGLSQVFIHAITDGRDTPPNSGRQYVEELLANIKKLGIGQLATITGLSSSGSSLNTIPILPLLSDQPVPACRLHSPVTAPFNSIIAYGGSRNSGLVLDSRPVGRYSTPRLICRIRLHDET